MSNADHFRKQAKQILRWHREGHFPVAAQIREHLPRFAPLTEPQIMQGPFRLADAQELVARREGFEDWAALLKGLQTMTHSAPGDTSTILTAEPQLFVTDMARALAFYVDKLGFEVALSYGEPPFWAQVARGGGRLNLRLVKAMPGPPADEDLLSATLTLDAAKPLFLEYQAAGVAFHQSLRTEPWGARTFIVGDQDGNLILFAGS